jgi:hypothetical protein
MATYEETLERVRGLLAKAAASEFPAEADVFRAKADELMTKHAIEQWQIDQQQAKASSVAIRKDLDISWYWGMDDELSTLLWRLASDVMFHCRVEIVLGMATYRTKSVPIVGMPSDLGYADLLFTHLMTQVIDQMDPKPRPGESKGSALARMKESGMKWKDIYRRLVDAGLQEDLGPWSPKVASKCNYAGLYTNYCAETSRKRLRVSPAVHRRSFIYGFNNTMYERLRSMREDQGQYTGSMALALREYRDKVKDAVWIHFPELKPHPENCECESCVDRREAAAKTATKKTRKGPKPRYVKIDRGSMDEGSLAAQQVELVQRGDDTRQRIAGELDA